MNNNYFRVFRTVLVPVFCLSFAACRPQGSLSISTTTSTTNPSVSTGSSSSAGTGDTPGSHSTTDPTTSLTDTIPTESTSSKSVTTEPPSTPIIADVTLQIKNNKAVLTNYNGSSGIYHGYAYMPDSTREEYSEAEAQLEYDRLEAAGVTLVRTKLYQSWAWNEGTNKWNWNSERMQAFYKWLDEMDKRGIEVAVNMAWSYDEICQTTSIEGYENPFAYLAGNNDLYDCLEYYAKWGTDIVNEVIINRGHTNVKYFVILTEPNNHGYGEVEANTKESFFIWRDVIKTLHDQMTSDGVRNKVKFVGPNSTTNCPEFLNWAVEYANNYIDIYSTHVYGLVNWMYEDMYSYWSDWADKALKIVKPTGKPLWNDEANTYRITKGLHTSIKEEPWHGTQIVLSQIALMNSGMERSMLWSLVNQKWPDRLLGAETAETWEDGVHRCGILNDMKTSTIPYLGYYAYALAGKYTKGTNSKIYEGVGEDGVYLTMVEMDNGQVTIIAANMNFDDKNVAFKMDKAINKTLYQHVFDPLTTKPTTKASIIGVSKTFNNVGSSFTATIPAGGVAVYTSIK